MISISSTILSLLFLTGRSGAFAPVSSSRRLLLSPIVDNKNNGYTIITNLHAKGRKSGGKGFGKTVVPSQANDESSPVSMPPRNDNLMTTNTKYGGLTSVDDTTISARPEIELDPNLSAEERTEAIMKQKFGLRSLEDQQSDIRAAERKVENKKRMQKIRNMTDEEFDIFQFLPEPVLKGIDLFLKAGLTLSTVLFILAGIGITFEAWAVTTGNKLPAVVDQFIVSIVEPNFTAGLGVLLGFSISLGIFATAQLGSKKSVYKEEP